MLTPDDYLEIYWKAYVNYEASEIPGRSPIKQKDLMKYALNAVINAAKQEQVKEMAGQYLNFSNH